jgi:5-(carboxyamino)imidazole ribonucleotide mutase
MPTAHHPVVSLVMGSISDLPVVRKASLFLEETGVPFEMLSLSAHRTPAEVSAFATGAAARGVKVIIAAAGMAAHLAGVIASMTTLPVIGLPVSGGLNGLDALLSTVQMPPGVPVATVGIDAGQNAAVLAVQILALNDDALRNKLDHHKQSLKDKVAAANEELHP